MSTDRQPKEAPLIFEVRLSNSSLVAIVDASDAPLVAGLNWYLAGGLSVRANIGLGSGKQQPVYIHRLILGAPKGSIVDHKNGNVLDNRRANLRICTHARNMQNSKTHSNSKSGIRNVAFRNKGGGRYRWIAAVSCNGVLHRKWFGASEDAKLEAERWAAAKRAELHGEFAVDAR